jgi:hypothetical protein
MAAQYRSPAEFREVMDRIFTMMSDDPEMGPKLRDADVPQRFEFDDVDMVVNVRAGSEGEDNIVWVWTDDVDWEPRVRMAMSSETANKYFQGKENVAIAIAPPPPPPDQGGRRREGGAVAHPGDEAHLRALPRSGRRGVPAPEHLTGNLFDVDSQCDPAVALTPQARHKAEEWAARRPQGAAGQRTSADGRRGGTLSPRAAGPQMGSRR